MVTNHSRSTCTKTFFVNRNIHTKKQINPHHLTRTIISTPLYVSSLYTNSLTYDETLLRQKLKSTQRCHISSTKNPPNLQPHTNMTVKDCGHHDDERNKLHRRLLAGALVFIFLVLFVILLIFLILRPTKPHFVLLDATVYAFNVSSPNFLSSNLQLTLSSRNPNARIGIYYDKLDIYATYRSQQITLPTLLPGTYQGHKDVNVWSPFVYGSAVPVAPYLAETLLQDQMAGTVLINIKVDGRVRWKVGTFISGRYHLYVNCPAYMSFGGRNNYNGGGGGIPVGSPGIKYQLVQNCHVDV